MVKLADLWIELGKTEAVEEMLLGISDTCENLASITAEAWVHKVWAFSCGSLARYYREKDHYDQAVQYYDLQLELYSNLVESDKTTENLRNMLAAGRNLADVCFLDNDVETALEMYVSSIDLADAILERTETVQAYIDLAGLQIHFHNAVDLKFLHQFGDQFHTLGVRSQNGAADF